MERWKFTLNSLRLQELGKLCRDFHVSIKTKAGTIEALTVVVSNYIACSDKKNYNRFQKQTYDLCKERRTCNFPPGYPEPHVAQKVLMRSRQLKLNFPVMPGYKLRSFLSDPILFTLLPKDFNDVIPLKISNFTRRPGCFYYGLFLKIYNPEKFTGDGPFPKTVKFRHGSNASLNPYDYENMLTVEEFQTVIPNQVINFNFAVPGNKWPHPYYFVAVELDVLKTTKPAALVPAISPQLPTAFQIRSAKDIIAKAQTNQKNNDVCASTVTLSLRCPLSFTRLESPIRFSSCKHLQCLEESTWKSLASGNHKKQLKCPICAKIVSSIYDGFIDGYTLDILSKVGKNVDEVIVDTENNFKWKTLKNVETVDIEATSILPVRNKRESLVIDDFDVVPLLDDEDVQVVEMLLSDDDPEKSTIIPNKRYGSSIDDAILL